MMITRLDYILVTEKVIYLAWWDGLDKAPEELESLQNIGQTSAKKVRRELTVSTLFT